MIINRAVIIIKPKKPAVDWINRLNPIKGGKKMSVIAAGQDSLIYLVPRDVESYIHAHEWVMSNVDTLFAEFLDGWYQDGSLWPKVLGAELFEKWFTIEYHSMVIDTIDEPVLKEDM